MTGYIFLTDFNDFQRFQCVGCVFRVGFNARVRWLIDSLENFVKIVTYASSVTVNANERVEKIREDLGYADISGYSLVSIIPIVHGPGATTVIPFFSGVSMTYVTFYNFASVQKTVATQLRCIYVKE